MKLYMIRHGQTEWNVSNRWQGRQDIALDETGERQARLLARKLERAPILAHAIYTSPLKRAYETASAISLCTGLPLKVRDDIMELYLGPWEGKTLAEVQETHGDAFHRWETELDPQLDIDVETHHALQTRAYSAVMDIIRREGSGRDAVMVTHGGFIRAFITHIMGLHMDQKLLFQTGNVSLNIFTYSHETNQFQIITLNDMSHLWEDNRP